MTPPTVSQPLTWEQRTAQLEAAFRKLPIWKSETPGALTYEFFLSGIPRELALMGGNRRSIEFHSKMISSATARTELAVVAKCADKLVKTLDRLHKPSIDALNFRTNALKNLTTSLRLLQTAASLAEVPNLPPNGGKGAEVKVGPQRLALRVAEHFYGLTGTKPTIRTPANGGGAYGPFIELLTTVFAVLNIKAGVESQAKEAIKAMEEKLKKSAI